jgi:hypothetical protein
MGNTTSKIEYLCESMSACVNAFAFAIREMNWARSEVRGPAAELEGPSARRIGSSVRTGSVEGRRRRAVVQVGIERLDDCDVVRERVYLAVTSSFTVDEDEIAYDGVGASVELDAFRNDAVPDVGLPRVNVHHSKVLWDLRQEDKVSEEGSMDVSGEREQRLPWRERQGGHSCFLVGTPRGLECQERSANPSSNSRATSTH